MSMRPSSSEIIGEVLRLADEHDTLLTGLMIAKMINRNLEEELERVETRIKALIILQSGKAFSNEAQRDVAISAIKQGQFDLLKDRFEVFASALGVSPEEVMAKLQDLYKAYKKAQEAVRFNRDLLVDPLTTELAATKARLSAVKAIMGVMANELVELAEEA